MFLKKLLVDDCVVLIDTRSGTELARIACDPTKRTSTLPELAKAMAARDAALKQQQAWERKVLPTLLHEPLC